MKHLDTLEKRFGEARDKAEQFAAATKGVSAAASEAGNAAARSAPKMSNFVQSIARIAKYRLIRAVIRSITDAVKEGANNFYEYSKAVGAPFAAAMDNVKASSLTMKNQVGSAFGELYQAVAPIILDLISYVTELAELLSKMWAAFNGANGWYKATNGANETAEAIGGVGAAAKKALKYLAPFDELNRLPEKSEGGGGGGASTGANYNNMFDFQAFEENSAWGKIAGFVRENLEAIELLVDIFGFSIGVAALMAGNIPLGLGMMLYFGYKGVKNVSANWDTIKTQMQGSLGQITTVVSVALLALGAILLFSGASVPLGLGMIIAGAAGLATAVAANWDAIITQLRGELGLATAIIGGALLVLGIFALLGGNIPLGLGLILAGASGLAATVAANWDNIKDIGRQFVDNIKAGIEEKWSGIKGWVDEHILSPFKDAVSDGGVNSSGFGVSLPFSVKFDDFTLPDIQALNKAWKDIKTKTATLTAKKAGTTTSIFERVSAAWQGIVTKASTLTADLNKDFDENVLQSIKDSWASIKKKTVSLTTNLKGTSSKTFTAVGNAWDKVYTKAATLTADLYQKFSTSTLDSITDAWSAIKSKTAKFTAELSVNKTVTTFVNAWNALKDKTLELKAKLSESVTNTWNKAANAWNNNSILKKLATLPTLARGGVVDQATFIGNAIVGEAGKEAIVPLERNTEWVSMVAAGLVKQIQNMQSGQTDSTTLTEAMYNAMSRALAENTDDRDIILDGNVVYRSVVQRNKNETFRLGRNPLLA